MEEKATRELSLGCCLQDGDLLLGGLLVEDITARAVTARHVRNNECNGVVVGFEAISSRFDLDVRSAMRACQKHHGRGSPTFHQKSSVASRLGGEQKRSKTDLAAAAADSLGGGFSAVGGLAPREEEEPVLLEGAADEGGVWGWYEGREDWNSVGASK